MEVIPNIELNLEGKQVRIELGEKELAVADFSYAGIGQRQQATLWWVLDTSELEAGNHVLSFSISPEGPTWEEPIILYPEKDNPYLDAGWESTTTDCCTLYYISGLESDRPIPSPATKTPYIKAVYIKKFRQEGVICYCRSRGT